MTPKLLHFCFFGDRPLNELNRRCIASAVEKLPGWTIKLWGNEVIEQCPWMKKAFDQRLFASASNYFRVWKLLHEGGVYVDVDVEILKPFDLTPACFIGFQRNDTKEGCLNTAVMGCEPGHWLPRRLVEIYDGLSPKDTQGYAACEIPARELYARGMDGLDKTQMVQDVKVYSRDYFHPINWENRAENHTNENTVCIHHFEGSWWRE